MSTEIEPQTPPSSDPSTTPTEPTTPTTSEPSLISQPQEPTPPAFGLDPLDAEKLKTFLPEGHQLDEGLSTKFLEAVNSATSREAFAQQMLSLQAEMLQQAETSALEAWEATQTAWKSEVQADPEFGGQKLAASLATARTLIETHAKDPAEAAAIKQFMDLTGSGNSIHMIRLLNRLAARIPGEAKPVEGTPAPTDKSRADKLFDAV